MLLVCMGLSVYVYGAAHACAHTCARRTAQLVSFHTRTRTDSLAARYALTCTHTRIRTPHARTFALTRAGGRALAVGARARSAAGPQRCITPLTTGTRRCWSCSRTAPTCTQRTSGGAAAGRYFGQRSACAAPAVAGRDGTDATQIGMHTYTHTRIDVEFCMRLNTHTHAHKGTRTCTLRTHMHTHTRAHRRTHTRTFPRTRTDGSRAAVCARARSSAGTRRSTRPL
jgi:hypothetical protein